MKKLTKIVCMIMIIVGVIGIAPTVEAVSYVWVNFDSTPTHVDEGRLSFTAEPWTTGATVTEPWAVTEFKWVVGGVDYTEGWSTGHADIGYISVSYDEIEYYGQSWLHYHQEPYPPEQIPLVDIHIDLNPWHMHGIGVPDMHGVGKWIREGEQVIPEPSVLLLLGTGLIGLMALRRKVSQKR